MLSVASYIPEFPLYLLKALICVESIPVSLFLDVCSILCYLLFTP